jgi:2-aminoadipate transaminase
MMTQEISSWLLDNQIVTQQREVRAQYREKARSVLEWLNQSLGGEIEEYSGGQAGFYFYLTFKRVTTHERSPFFRYLTRMTGDLAIDGPAEAKRPRVLYLPGEHCVHPQGALAKTGLRQLRLSYGYSKPSTQQSALCARR